MMLLAVVVVVTVARRVVIMKTKGFVGSQQQTSRGYYDDIIGLGYSILIRNEAASFKDPHSEGSIEVENTR